MADATAAAGKGAMSDRNDQQHHPHPHHHHLAADDPSAGSPSFRGRALPASASELDSPSLSTHSSQQSSSASATSSTTTSSSSENQIPPPPSYAPTNPVGSPMRLSWFASDFIEDDDADEEVDDDGQSFTEHSEKLDDGHEEPHHLGADVDWHELNTVAEGTPGVSGSRARVRPLVDPIQLAFITTYKLNQGIGPGFDLGRIVLMQNLLEAIYGTWSDLLPSLPTENESTDALIGGEELPEAEDEPSSLAGSPPVIEPRTSSKRQLSTSAEDRGQKSPLVTLTTTPSPDEDQDDVPLGRLRPSKQQKSNAKPAASESSKKSSSNAKAFLLALVARARASSSPSSPSTPLSSSSSETPISSPSPGEPSFENRSVSIISRTPLRRPQSFDNLRDSRPSVSSVASDPEVTPSSSNRSIQVDSVSLSSSTSSTKSRLSSMKKKLKKLNDERLAEADIRPRRHSASEAEAMMWSYQLNMSLQGNADADSTLSPSAMEDSKSSNNMGIQTDPVEDGTIVWLEDVRPDENEDTVLGEPLKSQPLVQEQVELPAQSPKHEFDSLFSEAEIAEFASLTALATGSSSPLSILEEKERDQMITEKPRRRSRESKRGSISSRSTSSASHPWTEDSELLSKLQRYSQSYSAIAVAASSFAPPEALAAASQPSADESSFRSVDTEKSLPNLPEPLLSPAQPPIPPVRRTYSRSGSNKAAASTTVASAPVTNTSGNTVSSPSSVAAVERLRPNIPLRGSSRDWDYSSSRPERTKSLPPASSPPLAQAQPRLSSDTVVMFSGSVASAGLSPLTGEKSRGSSPTPSDESGKSSSPTVLLSRRNSSGDSHRRDTSTWSVSLSPQSMSSSSSPPLPSSSSQPIPPRTVRPVNGPNLSKPAEGDSNSRAKLSLLGAPVVVATGNAVATHARSSSPAAAGAASPPTVLTASPVSTTSIDDELLTGKAPSSVVSGLVVVANDMSSGAGDAAKRLSFQKPGGGEVTLDDVFQLEWRL
ncbi:hypothetical protein DFJ73DRAFT_819140 [Zopfochytrium polystomum]|nr:hypothetical protein DFJ73DRAFT_819140 [Zopfochytrium polystomum]